MSHNWKVVAMTEEIAWCDRCGSLRFSHWEIAPRSLLSEKVTTYATPLEGVNQRLKEVPPCVEKVSQNVSITYPCKCREEGYKYHSLYCQETQNQIGEVLSDISYNQSRLRNTEDENYEDEDE